MHICTRIAVSFVWILDSSFSHDNGKNQAITNIPVHVIDDTEVTLKRNPKTDGLRRATQKAHETAVLIIPALLALLRRATLQNIDKAKQHDGKISPAWQAAA